MPLGLHRRTRGYATAMEALARAISILAYVNREDELVAKVVESDEAPPDQRGERL